MIIAIKRALVLENGETTAPESVPGSNFQPHFATAAHNGRRNTAAGATTKTKATKVSRLHRIIYEDDTHLWLLHWPQSRQPLLKRARDLSMTLWCNWLKPGHFPEGFPWIFSRNPARFRIRPFIKICASSAPFEQAQREHARCSYSRDSGAKQPTKQHN